MDYRYPKAIENYKDDELIELWAQIELYKASKISGAEFLYKNIDYYDQDALRDGGYLNKDGEVIIKKSNENKVELLDEYMESFGNYKKEYSTDQLMIDVAAELDFLDKEYPQWQAEVGNYNLLNAVAKAVYSDVKPISRKRLFTRRGGWYKEPVNHGFAAKGVKVGQSRVKR